MAGFKGTKRSASRAEDSDEEDAVLPKPTKKTKTTSGTGSGTDKEGNPFWELSAKRRIGISKFKDMTMVNVREYFEKDGDMLPGKKGISLSLPQYEALLKAIPQINAKLEAMGHNVEDSEHAGGASTAAENAAPGQGLTGQGLTGQRLKKSRQQKSNIEATSDEEED